MGALKRILVGLIGLFAASAAVAQEMNWVKVTSYLTARDQHAMAYDAARGQVVLFGGVGYSGTLNDTWVWDGTNWVEKTRPHVLQGATVMPWPTMRRGGRWCSSGGTMPQARSTTPGFGTGPTGCRNSRRSIPAMALRSCHGVRCGAGAGGALRGVWG
jgi:hypothetical protein